MKTMSEARKKIFGRYSEVMFLILGGVLGIVGTLSNTLLEQRQQTKILEETADEKKRMEVFLLLSEMDKEFAAMLNSSINFYIHEELIEDSEVLQKREAYYGGVFSWSYKIANRGAAIKYYFGKEAAEFWRINIVSEFEDARIAFSKFSEGDSNVKAEEFRRKVLRLSFNYSYFSYRCNEIVFSNFTQKFSSLDHKSSLEKIEKEDLETSKKTKKK